MILKTVALDKDYCKEKSKFSDLQLRHRAVDAALTQSLLHPRISINDERAMALLDSEAGPVAGDGISDAEISRLRDELSVLDRALVLQRAIVDRECTRASLEITTSILPLHRKLVGEVISAAVHLARANANESNLRYELESAGVLYQAGGIRPMCFLPSHSGLLNDPYSMISAYLREAVAFGYLSQAEADRLTAEE